MRHCDEIIDDETEPFVLRDFLRYHLLPAVCKCAGMTKGQIAVAAIFVEPELHSFMDNRPTEPVLFADYEGRAVRVTMASRLGDVGINSDLTKTVGYDKRVPVEVLTNFRDHPYAVAPI